MVNNKTYSEKIVRAYKAVSEWIVRGLGQPPQWPRNLMEWVYYQSRFFPKEFLRTTKKLEKKGFDLYQIAKLFQYPSSVTHWLYFPESNFGVRGEYWAYGLSTQEGIEFIEKTIDILSILRKEDTFCNNFKNILLKKEEIIELVQSYEFIEVDQNPEFSTVLPMLNMTLWHYAILIQGGLRIYSQELHGPYSLDDDETLFVREYFNLKPTRIWEFTSAFPYDKIIFYEIYKDLQIHVDMFGHYWTSSHPYHKLARVSIITDNKRNLDIHEVKNLYKKSSDTLNLGNSTIKNFSRMDWYKKWIELGYFGLKPLKDVLREDWYPPQDILTMAKSDEEFKKAQESGQYHLRLVGTALTTLSKEKAVAEICNMHLKTIYNEWERKDIL